MLSKTLQKPNNNKQYGQYFLSQEDGISLVSLILVTNFHTILLFTYYR
jgi:hypothetical protein